MDSLRRQYKLIEKIQVWFGEKTAIVYTMGKVGTLTVCNSLSEIGFKHVHPHSLRYSWPGVYFLRVDLPVYKKIKYALKTILKRIKVWIWIKLTKDIYIITGVRDPFSRNISAFFEQAHYIGGLDESLSSNEVRGIFEDRCDFYSAINWFDKEVLKVTGVDVYGYDFDKEKGFSVIKKGKFNLFVYRIDKLNDLESEMSNFIGQSGFKIKSTNISDEGAYKERLKKLKKEYRYDFKKLRKISSSKYMSHFYTEDEVESLIKRWQ